MIVILTTIICIRAMCIEVYVPTPVAFQCDDPSYHEKYLAQEFPRWRYKGYRCDLHGRFV
jgi:hypothetical protein